ncbi:G-type lectin S-receptor-like serine/threonine-protein kinase CES101, partial [Pyrus x bretschneideri]|uniref:G-type lectin S-receptor-like serine/threonine-protein kinase CES101 n=1 Tax=Pyrus x bretschneideri TaxID=225117 RepID=UPI0020301E84
DTLAPGDTLDSLSSLESASAKFTLSFVEQLYSNFTYLVIRRNKYNPNKAWIGNRNRPISSSSSPLLTLDWNYTLKITQTGEDPIVISSAPQTSNGTSSGVVATLLDSGNLVLQEMNGSRVFWQSFDYPGDTFLPGMKLGVNRSDGHIWSLVSYVDTYNPAPGPFSLVWDPIEHELKINRSGVLYWTSGVLRSDGTFEFILPNVSKQRYNFSIVSNENYGYLTYTSVVDQSLEPEWVLYSSGILQEYEGRMNIVQAQNCDGYDTGGGCVQRFQSTKSSGTKIDKWVWIGTSIAAALVLCTAYYLLRRRRSALASAGENRTEIENEMLNFMKSNRPTDDVNGLRNDGKIGHHDLSVFSYSTILAATSNFAEENKLGEGGFGPVYKGKLAMGQEIAVKRLSKCSGQGTSEFKNELILIYELQHRNLVQLFGFCIHGEEMMLIYEYLQNKSLDHFLFDPTRGRLLDWKKRLSILEGIAQGLLYLHKYSRKKVIHRDLKASNILLDENMNPKISDFGLARIFTQNELEANTSKIVGTRGYMPPESMEGIISVKSDVYSFGVLILEILSGRKNNSFYNDDRALNLVGYAWELWKEGAGLELRDPTLGNSFIKEQLLRCIHVGLLCVEENAADRPTMSDVISMLTNESLPLASPTKPAFFVGRRTVEAGISGNQQLEIASANYMSSSDFEAR